MATEMADVPIIAACSLTKLLVTVKQPWLYGELMSGSSEQSCRCLPKVSTQQDSGTNLYIFQSCQLSTPQHCNRSCVVSQAIVISGRLPYNAIEECISWRNVCLARSRKTYPNIPPMSIVTKINETMIKYWKRYIKSFIKILF